MIKRLTAAGLALAAFALPAWKQRAAKPAKRTLSHQLPDLPTKEAHDPAMLGKYLPPIRKAG